MSSSRSSMADVPFTTGKEESRGMVISEPRYNDGVLDGMWRDRRIEKTKACLPPLRGTSIYNTSYREPGDECYEDDHSSWANRSKHEGLDGEILMQASGPKCRQNFTTSTDLAFRIIPQLCPTRREFNTRHLEWLPTQDFLPCVGDLTRFGLQEYLLAKWEQERQLMRNPYITMYHSQYHRPCDEHRVTSRSAICRLFSSSLQTNNALLVNQRFRGNQILVAPNVLMGQYPVDIKRSLLPIVPELPTEPPGGRGDPADRLSGPHPFPTCCVRVDRCRRVPLATPDTAPAVPFYHTPCPPPLPAPL